MPTTALRDQWLGILDANSLSLNCEVLVINTAIKNRYKCDLLVLDESHRYSSDNYRKVFETIEYKYILGLTATFERLDGKHEIMNKYCPVFDEVTLADAIANGWVSNYIEYKVIVDVPDMEIYDNLNKQFTEYFQFFNFDWDVVSNCLGKNGFKYRTQLRDIMCPNGTPEQKKQIFRQITTYSVQFMRIVQQRKAFINNHPKKIELARKIIEARPNSKIITFSNNIKMAESIGGPVYSGRDSKKKGRITMEEFIAAPSGVLNTIKKADEGIDVKNLSVAIILGIDSSKIKSIQRLGRVIRKEEDKKPEIFTILINNTVELDWYKRSHTIDNAITIDEQGLYDVLNGKVPKPYKKKLRDFQFRF